MQSALKTTWTEDLSEQMKLLSTPPARRNGSALSENVVRPTFLKDRSASQKPDLSAALDAVVRAADGIKAAQDRAVQAEEQIRLLTEEGASQMRAAEQQIAALDDRARTAEDRLAAVTERAAEKLADADRDLKAARDQIRREEERANSTEARATQQIAELQALLKDANDRIFAAETRAMECKEDLNYLENYIRERFAL